MRTYRRLSWLLGGCFLIVVASSCWSFGIKKDYQQLTGSWREEWGSDDVKYNDVYQIAHLGGNKLAITCKERNNYIISKVSYEKKTLRLQVEVRDNKYKTGSANIQYELKLIKSPLLLTGTVINHESKTISVRWVKQ
jgi:hypothetical protein